MKRRHAAGASSSGAQIPDFTKDMSTTPGDEKGAAEMEFVKG